MEPKEQLAEVMKNTSLIALATSVEDTPNVRIMDIFFDEKRNVVVFPTSSLSRKIKEFEANDTVAFTTIPQGPGPVVRVANATVAKSDWSIDEIKDTLLAHRPGFEMMLKGFGENVAVYEIAFNMAVIAEKGQKTIVEL
ncbi:pyridoxamine 5'-phosphate oxidase family protein [Anaerotardibacter muris]|uniref:pyridoxamine 5'-phosphate oxidase family protein n=1 Tax=Anaerotardibacter muris TaxID=2941505 RepID=UPI00203B15CA|nr:pyridoxamine 5'-phosphate oxidase family protein [Anaerotardibacter muris]